MKKIILYVALFCSGIIFAQETQDTGSFFGGFESNSQWLLDDDGINFTAPEDQFRSNNYFQLNYNYGKFTVGAQYESYLPSSLLGYAPVYDGNNNIGTYFLNYRTEQLDITGGYFYEQFGSGLIFRSWEDRQLGVNNAVRGVRIKFNPLSYLDLTGMFGQQRNGFELSEGTIGGLDANVDLSSALKIEKVDLKLGMSYVARYQDNGTNDDIPSTVGAFGGRLEFGAGNFYAGIEAITKDNDVVANEGMLSSNKLYDGTALQVDLGYAQKGLGINYTFRRLENYNFYADRLAEGNVYNQQIMNYVPALTKQQDYLLTNIYVYNAQPRLSIDESNQASGEVGSQLDVFYSFKKESALGKVGTKIAANFAYWAGLEAEYNIPNKWYEAKFIGKGTRLYRDFSVEIKNKWNNKLKTVLTYQNTIIDQGIVKSTPVGISDIKANIFVEEFTYKFNKGRSFRFVLQQLWTKEDRKNWLGGVAEYNFNSRLAIYIADSWNYGGTDEIHYYNIGGSYSKGNTRLGVNYGRQRGGLICVGGVCRFVPENTGLSANLTVSF